MFRCAQGDPTGLAACLAKAQPKCAQETGKLQGAEAKFRKAVAAACGPTAVSPTDLLDRLGVGYGGHAARCKTLGVPALTSLGQVVECLVREHGCRARQLLDEQMPRARELLRLGGVP